MCIGVVKRVRWLHQDIACAPPSLPLPGFLAHCDPHGPVDSHARVLSVLNARMLARSAMQIALLTYARACSVSNTLKLELNARAET
eukprot:3142716-Rhodomonas_salina.2